MTRPEWFQELARLADRRIPWLRTFDGVRLCYKAGEHYGTLFPDTKDTDPDACVFQIWGLTFLKDCRPTATISARHVPPMGWEITYGGFGIAGYAPTLLDAVGLALVAVLKAMEEAE